MKTELSNKAFLGLDKWLIPIPAFLIRNDVRSSGDLICQETRVVTDLERKVQFYVVQRISDTNQPVLPVEISTDFNIPLAQVISIIEKLESLKVFFYRYNSPGINWAYPVTSDESEYKLTYDDGKKCTAA